MNTELTGLNDDPFSNLETGFPPERVHPPIVATLKSEKTLPAKMPWYWLTRADELGGSALAVGLVVLRNHAMTAPYGWPNRVGLESGEIFGLGRKAVRHGLNRLADGGLIRYELKPGSKPVVDVLRVEPAKPGSDWLGHDLKLAFIFHRIPLDWISRAALCPTPALLAGLAAWRYDYMTDIPGESRFSIHPLAGSTRPGSAMKRGLVSLESAGLVELLDAPRGYARLKIIKRGWNSSHKGAEHE